MTYSWSKILSGGNGCCEVLYECENLVFFNISMTSEFLLISSPSFSPEVKWAHTKQKVVPCNVMLIDIEPCCTPKKMIMLRATSLAIMPSYMYVLVVLLFVPSNVL